VQLRAQTVRARCAKYILSYCKLSIVYKCKNYESWLAGGKVIATMSRLTFLAHPIQISSTFIFYHILIEMSTAYWRLWYTVLFKGLPQTAAALTETIATGTSLCTSNTAQVDG